MRYLVTFILSMLSMMTFAEVITMDLATATNLNGDVVTFSESYGDGYYDLTHVWDSTYSDMGMHQFIYTNDQRFMLSHMPSQNSYGGMSWEGFTISRVSQDTANVFGCVANGGLAGVGTPYVIGYFSEWVTMANEYSSNIIMFDQEYYPEYVYICQNSNTMEAITHGNVFNARAFTEQDTLTLVIAALDMTLAEGDTIHYHLAVNGEKNNGWVKVPLTALGKTAGLSFRMTTTDMGEYGANTPLYFALDGLTVNTEPTTDVQNISISSHIGMKIVRNNQLFILRGETLFTPLGQEVR